MSQFDKYTRPEYVEALRSFLRVKKDFLKEVGIARKPNDKPRGRLPRYDEEPVVRLEEAVNEKSARCEAPDTLLNERFKLARDYTDLNDSQVSRHMDVSRELVRRWGSGENVPHRLPELAALFNVPLAWLEEGGEKHLPANSHLGVRVGQDALFWREQLYSLTVEVISEIPDGASDSYIQAFIEWAVFNNPELSIAARRAGGRWQVVNGSMLFAPWVPIPEHGLSRRKWSDEVEAIIQEELSTKPTVYAAWKAMEARCKEKGYTELKDYPAKISLHKRVSKETERAEKFGVDLNAIVAEAVASHTIQ